MVANGGDDRRYKIDYGQNQDEAGREEIDYGRNQDEAVGVHLCPPLDAASNWQRCRLIRCHARCFTMVSNCVTRCFSIAKISHMMRRYALAAGFAGIRWRRLPSEVRLRAVPAGADAFIRAGWGCGPG